MVGGVGEYLSLLAGYQFLLILVAGCYVLAIVMARGDLRDRSAAARSAGGIGPASGSSADYRITRITGFRRRPALGRERPVGERSGRREHESRRLFAATRVHVVRFSRSAATPRRRTSVSPMRRRLAVIAVARRCCVFNPGIRVNPRMTLREEPGLRAQRLWRGLISDSGCL